MIVPPSPIPETYLRESFPPQLLGWAKYSLCFIDTVMLVHFLSAAGAFLEAKHIHENTPKDQLRFFISLSLATTVKEI